jgi:hypothetical protein
MDSAFGVPDLNFEAELTTVATVATYKPAHKHTSTQTPVTLRPTWTGFQAGSPKGGILWQDDQSRGFLVNR